MKLFKLHRSPNGRQAAAVVITVIFVLLLSIFYLRESAESRAKASGTGREGINPPHAASAITLEPRVVAPAHSAGSIESIQQRLLFWMSKFEELAGEPGLAAEERQEKARRLLAGMREELRSNPADSAAAILDFLKGGADVATGLGFTLADGGLLDEAPSLRTALLDLLAQVDPFASVDYAETIFESSTVADEWALAMRNLGWQNQDGMHSEELRSRLTEMLDSSAWLGQPSGGFLEAFDIAVHLGGVEEFRSMASVVKLEYENGVALENGTTHAAYLALDRLASAAPAKFVAALTDDPALLAWAPEHRASLVARADVSEPGQRLALERYLETLAERPDELETFTSLFPNRNTMLGRALVTTPLPDLGFREMLAQDEAALAAVRDWMSANRYPAIETNLREVERRLAGFVEEARKEGLEP